MSARNAPRPPWILPKRAVFLFFFLHMQAMLNKGQVGIMRFTPRERFVSARPLAPSSAPLLPASVSVPNLFCPLPSSLSVLEPTLLHSPGTKWISLLYCC